MRHDESGWHPVHFLAQAVNRGHLQAPAGSCLQSLALLGSAETVVGLLISKRCYLDAPVAEYAAAAAGYTALYLLEKPHRKRSRSELDAVLSLAEAILRNGGRPDRRLPHSGRTPLALAASVGQEDMARLLIRYGADPSVPEGDGATPAELCRRGCQPAMAAALDELAAEVGERAKRPRRRRHKRQVDDEDL